MSGKAKWKYEVGQVIKDEKRDMIILDREMRGKSVQYYKYHCNIDGNEDWINGHNLNRGDRCNVCANKKVMLGVNTIWDTDRYLITDYGLDEEFAKTHTIGTDKKGKFTCKDCGNIKSYRPSHVKHYKSIGCSYGDNTFSYPEKFVYSMLKQLNIDFEFQLTRNNFEWIGNYRYDFYIPSLDLILETHGGQHGNFITSGELTLVKKTNGFSNLTNKNEIKNDAYKCWLAYKNKVDKYIQLDCSKSDMNYIKNSILNSKLANIFNLNNIVWNKCNEFALKNITKEVCDYWHKHREINGEDIATNDLIKYFKLSRDTIIEYLKHGTELEWCNYNPKEEIKRSGKKNGKKNGKENGKKGGKKGGKKNAEKNGKKVMCIELNKHFPSIKKAGRELNIDSRNIAKACNGKYKSAGKHPITGEKLHWEFVEETEDNNKN